MSRARGLWPATGLWRHGDFLRLWSAQIVSAFGSRITRTALPVIAVLSLSGTPNELALLAVLTIGPGVIVGLTAGGWIDRSRKRPILIAADLVRAVTVASLPLASALGRVHVIQVYAVGVIVGAANALFVMADGAYLPSLVTQAHVVEGNSKLQSTESVAEIAGPAVAGLLIQVLGAPLAVLLDALTYVWSAAFVGAIRHPEIAPPKSVESPHLLADAVVGLRESFGHPLVRPLALALGSISFSSGFFAALYMLYALTDLGLSISVIGSIIAAGGVGAILGVLAARWMPRVFGLGRTLVIALVGSVAATLFIPIAGSDWVPKSATIPLLVAHQLLGDGLFMIFTIHAVSLRQTVLPIDVLGRVNGALAALFGALLPLGAVVAGPLADVLGVREALFIGLGAGVLAPIAVAASPVFSLRSMPAPSTST
jgi:MFS family permease